MSGTAWPGRSTPVDPGTLKRGDVVSVVGIGYRQSAIVHVERVDTETSPLNVVRIAGRQPWGRGWRAVERVVRRSVKVERLDPDTDDDPNDGTR